MKRLLSFFILGAAVVVVIAATVKISDLPLSTSPSTNTFIEIADMNAVTKSAKFQFNGVTYKAVTNGMSWSGDTNNVIGGDGREQLPQWYQIGGVLVFMKVVLMLVTKLFVTVRLFSTYRLVTMIVLKTLVLLVLLVPKKAAKALGATRKLSFVVLPGNG